MVGTFYDLNQMGSLNIKLGDQRNFGQNPQVTQADWSWKLDDVLLAYRTALKNMICMSPY